MAVLQGVATFRERGLGPVLLEDRITYRKEIGLLEPYRVEIALAAATRDARRLRVRNTVRRADGQVAATVESVVLWLDLTARRPVVPPQDLAAIWLELERTEDFAWFD